MADDPQLIELLPRRKDQGYRSEDLAIRRRWLEQRTGASLTKIGESTLDSERMRGNVENPIGSVQIPLGVAGPLQVNGEHAAGVFYVPLATTEGALVRSYERGMVALTRCGGVTTRVLQDENRIAPSFFLPDVATAGTFIQWVRDNEGSIRERAEATTHHGKLLGLSCLPVGRQVIVNFSFDTGDAHGMNMICKATDAACRWMIEQTQASHFHMFSGYSAEKRSAGSLMAGGKGKRVIAGATIGEEILRAYFRVTVDEMLRIWQATVQGHLQTASLGYNGHFANGLTALFIASGQDVANVVNSAAGITSFEPAGKSSLHVSVTLPSLVVATVGGGTNQGTARECLTMMDCVGKGKARKLAEIAAATLLAGEISMAAAIASGEFVNAHEQYGRNRP
jgi:hydroxymethylglutaryl-CoA reductase (NADPH)